jgi:hypothetical protein
MYEIKPLITGVCLYGGNVHIAYRHIVKHQNVIFNCSEDIAPNLLNI